MKGRQHIEIRNNRSVFKFDLDHNISVIKGDSATGKTTLVDMIAEFQQYGADSGISLSSDKRCVVLGRQNWQQELKSISDCIVFIDEGNDFVKSKEFAEAIRGSDNYYVIVTRENLFELPVSIDAIYGIKGRKYFSLKQTYNSLYRIYPDESDYTKPEVVLTEDSGSGYEFFDSVAAEHSCECRSSNGNANILNELKLCENKSVLIIADGAAFGAYMEMLYDYRTRKNSRICAYLPESFEWIILSSGLIKDSDLAAILNEPWDHIDSKDHFSREQFYTALLIQKTEGTYLKYSKRKLNENYLHDKEKTAILSVLPKKLFEK